MILVLPLRTPATRKKKKGTAVQIWKTQIIISSS